MTTSSIQASEEDTTNFLRLLTSISEQQANICRQLDELILLMQLPSESVLRVLQQLLLPMNDDARQALESVLAASRS